MVVKALPKDDAPVWSVDLSAWTVKTSKQWTEAIRTDDYEAMAGILAKAVDTLPNGNAVTVENIEEMTLGELAGVIFDVQEAMSAIFRKARESR